MPSNIPTAPKRSDTEGYYTFSNQQDMEKALAQSISGNEYRQVIQAKGNRIRSFIDIDTDVSVRTGFTRQDYDYFRPDEALPVAHQEILRQCNSAYRKVGLIKKIIDLMGDFACQGVHLEHPQKSVENFYKMWFKKVKGKNRSERFVNNILRLGNVVIKRNNGKITVKNEQEFKKTFAEQDVEIDTLPETIDMEIPARYIFLNPMAIEVTGGNIQHFTGELRYSLKVPPTLKRALKQPQGLDRDLMSKIPNDIRRSLNGSSNSIPLPSDKLRVFHFKKDDWALWGDPFIYCVLDDVIVLEKLKMTDVAAMDGAMSQIRLWRLGDLEAKLIPKPGTILKLARMLEKNVGGGSMDLIWGPDLDFKESNSQVHKFLGQEKYIPTLTAIYSGLGIPPTLTGSAGGDKGFTNNFMSLKTLIETLEYVRSILVEFWEVEIELVRRAMGFQKGATVAFDHMVLADEAAEKALWLQLWDRDIVSDEKILEIFKGNHEIEVSRYNRERKLREKGKMAPKTGPWRYDSDFERDATKLFIQQGLIKPEDVEVDSSVDFDDAMDAKNKMGKFEQKPKGEPGDGRPVGSNDKSKRKQKRVLPKTKGGLNRSVDMMIWLKDTQSTIADIITMGVLKYYGKPYIKSLSDEQFKVLEETKFRVLCNISPFSVVNVGLVKDIMKKGGKLPAKATEIYDSLTDVYKNTTKRDLTVDNTRYLQLLSYMKLQMEK